VLLFDKPIGWSSNAALQRVKWLFQAAKAGHTGSLDPLATGLLPICFGQATKFSSFLLDADKYYRVRLRLGQTTTTADAEGECLTTTSTAHLNEAMIHDVIPRFVGVIQQCPPMYSAVKYQGQRLYKLARAGQEVDRQPRSVTIKELKVVDIALPEVELDVHCSKGTYIRVLAEDIGQALACGAHIIALRRTGVEPYHEQRLPHPLIGLQEIEAQAPTRIPDHISPADQFASLDAHLLPLDQALQHFPEVQLSANTTFYLRQGQSVLVPHAPTTGIVRLYDPNRKFLGIGYILEDGKIQPKRLR
jgi:tRNA pseudouridine55 synthase